MLLLNVSRYKLFIWKFLITPWLGGVTCHLFLVQRLSFCNNCLYRTSLNRCMLICIPGYSDENISVFSCACMQFEKHKRKRLIFTLRTLSLVGLNHRQISLQFFLHFLETLDSNEVSGVSFDCHVIHVTNYDLGPVVLIFIPTLILAKTLITIIHKV